MRIRKKKNLEERILSNNNLLLAYEGELSDATLYIKNKEYLDYSSIFGNSNPVELDLGCGFGTFLIEKAKQNPNINYIGVEKISNVLVSAIEKVKTMDIDNIRFLNIRVECLEKFIKDNSISTIYLNFSNPLPKKPHEKQRLTSKRFLDIYKKILVRDGKIIQKTDDKDFFEYSMGSFNLNEFVLSDINYDLTNNPVEGDIKTEHELRYIALGKTIYRLIANIK